MYLKILFLFFSVNLVRADEESGSDDEDIPWGPASALMKSSDLSDRLLDCLMKLEMLTLKECSAIKGNPSALQRKEAIFDKLRQKRHRGFESLCSALEETGRKKVLKKIPDSSKWLKKPAGETFWIRVRFGLPTLVAADLVSQ